MYRYFFVISMNDCRTLINTLEYSLTCLALAHYIRLLPTCSSSSSRPLAARGGQAYLALATLCVMIRPTAGMVWGPLVLLHVAQLLRYVDNRIE